MSSSRAGLAMSLAGIAFTAAAASAVRIDFETPDLGTAARAIASPYVAEGVSFAPEAGLSDLVVGLVKNRSTSACVGPEDDDQKLGCGRRSYGADGDIGSTRMPIAAVFESPLVPVDGDVFVAAEFQALAGTTCYVILYGLEGTQIAVAQSAALPEGDFCSYPGNPRSRIRVVAHTNAIVVHAVVDVRPIDHVYVIDNFEYGDMPVAVREQSWSAVKSLYRTGSGRR